MEPIVFSDLGGLTDRDRKLTADEDAWLTRIAAEVSPTEWTVEIGASCAAEQPEPVLQRGPDGRWQAGRYIGELRRDGQVLEIVPRLGIETIAAWAGACLNVRIVADSAERAGTSALIAQLVAAAWRSSVVAASRHGPPGFRAPRSHKGPYVRGRLDVSPTLRLRAARRPHIASVSRPKEIDNPVTRLIVLADRILDRRVPRPDWRGERLEEVLPRLRGAVGARPALPTRKELDRVRYTPLTLPYRRAAELSWQIAHNRGPRARATGEDSEGVLLDVAELWELFLLHCARRALGVANVTHGTQLMKTTSLLQSVSRPGRMLGRLYPDLLVGPIEQPVAVIDAKYKRLADPRGVDREDLYQLTSYLAAHSTITTPLGMLAYPRLPDQDRLALAETDGPWRTPFGNEVRFERLPTTEEGCVEALAELATRQSDEFSW